VSGSHSTEEQGRDVAWIGELLRQQGIAVDDEELPLVAHVYAEYERLMAVVEGVELPPDQPPALALDMSR